MEQDGRRTKKTVKDIETISAQCNTALWHAVRKWRLFTGKQGYAFLDSEEEFANMPRQFPRGTASKLRPDVNNHTGPALNPARKTLTSQRLLSASLLASIWALWVSNWWFVIWATCNWAPAAWSCCRASWHWSRVDCSWWRLWVNSSSILEFCFGTRRKYTEPAHTWVSSHKTHAQAQKHGMMQQIHYYLTRQDRHVALSRTQTIHSECMYMLFFARRTCWWAVLSCFLTRPISSFSSDIWIDTIRENGTYT